MTTGSATTDLQHPTKEPAFSSSRILSKIARSPTTGRKHRPLPSASSGSHATSISSDPSSHPHNQAALHSRLHVPSRPSFQRQISAPDTSALLKEEVNGPRHFSDASGQVAQQAKVLLNTQPTKAQTIPISTVPSLPVGEKGSNNMFAATVHSEDYADHRPSTAVQQAGTNYMFQQLHELSNKRIATLTYMRTAHEGKSFWFNTTQFSKSDISRMPSYTPNRASRRATNYFLLGISLPAVLDVHQLPHPSSSPQSSCMVALEFLKSLNILLAEFEAYQEKHPTDGSHVGSLSRARLPSMFKRSNTISRPRKSGSAPSTEIGAQISPPAVPETPHMHSHRPSIDTTTTATTLNSSTLTLVNPPFQSMTSRQQNFSNTATFPSPGPADALNSSLLPNEVPYTHLLTPPLPFAPDFYTVFATLCDVLIDTYQRLLQMVNSPSACTPMVAETFSKADARIRKIMVGAVVRDFETASRDMARRELAGVQKVVLGGILG